MRRAFHLTGIGICHFFQRRFDKAAAVLETSFRELPSYPLTAWFLAACYAQEGRLSEAREFVSRQAIGPGGPWLIIGRTFSNPAQRELALSGLRLATGKKHEPKAAASFPSPISRTRPRWLSSRSPVPRHFTSG